MNGNMMIDWLLRMAKGIIVGTGFILPGVSGGALAAIFGLYERMISFVAHLSRDFKQNFLFFLPVGIGMLSGIVLLSYPLGYCLEHYLAPTMWLFIGTIIGTFPALWKEAGKHGREIKHLAIMMAALVGGLAFLLFGIGFIGEVQQSFISWLIAGGIIALGILIPGLSPSNFLLYMGLYEAMVDGFKRFDLTVIVPLAIGGAICMLLLSKLVDLLFEKAYAVLFHIILGVVIASTLMIIPAGEQYTGLKLLVCAITCLAGAGLGLWMSGLEEKYKP